MSCKGCKYWRKINNYSSCADVCHYCHDTGIARGCSKEECYTQKIHFAQKGKNDHQRNRSTITPAEARFIWTGERK